MSTETQILALFEEGNPVPDLEGLGTIDIDAAAYLATLTARSSEMTQTDEKKEEQEEKRSVLPWLVAAATVVVLGVVLIVLSQGPEEVPPVTQLPPVTTIPEVIEETTVPAPTTTVDAVEAAWEEITSLSQLSRGGETYRTATFAPAMSFELPLAWSPEPLPEIENDFALAVGTSSLSFNRMGRGTVEETIEWVRQREGLTLSEPQPVVIGGAQGLAFDVDSDQFTGLLFRPEGQWTTDPDRNQRLWVLDVNGETVTIALGASKVAFDNVAQQTQGVLDSIVWKDLG